uniref:Uncharacterized protein n=1 Tax=Fagus sylvatica TaxID=28930 RepID=A0A2N9I4Q5_FAGSY
MMRTKGRKTTRIPVKQNRKGIPTPTPLHQGRRRHQSQKGKDSQLDSKIDSLEEKIRLIQGLNSFGNTDFSSMSWFPNMTVPPKFKAPEFEKYNGRGDPMIHLQMYCRKMAPYADNEPLLIPDISRYPDRECSRMRMEKKSNETFREYAQRWREKAARARPPLDEREMIKIFVDTLKNPYFDRMMGLQMQFFVDLIPVGERIEDALKTKKNSGHDGPNGISRTGRQESSDKEEGRRCANDREKQRKTKASRWETSPMTTDGSRKEPRQFTPLPMPMTELYPILIEKSLISPIVPKPYNGPQRRDFNPNSACDFHFGEVGHTVENCGQLRHRVQDLIDHGVLKFEGLPNITTNPLPKHPEGGVNMVEIEEGNEESIAWRRLFYTLEKQKHITPLDAPPGPSTGDSCEYHSGARGHSLDCCEEFKKKVTDLMENGIVGREEIPSKGSRQPDDPSDFDWYAEINLDDIVEDEMDLDNLQDEEADWGYFMEDDTDEWRDVDFTEFFQFPCLIVPPGFVTPEFEIFYEDGDPEVHLQKYGEKMALHLENELLMISVFPESLSKQAAAWFYQLRNLTGWDDLVRVFLERYRFNPHSILEYLGLKKDEEPYIIPDPGVSKVIVEIKEESDMSSLPALAEGEEEEKDKPPPPAKEPDQASPPLLKKNMLALWITRKTSNDPHVSKIDNKTDCSLDNIDNSDEEIELPSDILEALERQDEGSKPNIEELEIVNLANEGEESERSQDWNPLRHRAKGSTHCTVERVPRDLRLVLPRHARPRHRHSGPQDSFEARVQARKASTAPNEARSHFEDQGRGGKAVKGRIPKHSNLFGLGSQYSPSAEKGRKSQNQRMPCSHSWTDSQGTIRSRWPKEDKSKTAFVTHWGTFVYDVMPFGLKNAGATYQRAMVTLFHDMIHHEIEVYVDDMIAKSRTAQDHLTDLRKLFQRLKKYQLRLNPNKCAFGVTSGKLLGFIVSGRGIEIDPAKVVPSFYTSQSKKHPWAACWDNKTRLGRRSRQSTILARSSRSQRPAYLLVEKTCCALAWASKKLRQYMLYYTTWLVSRMDPIKYIFEKPALTGKIARWQVLLSEFDILFVAPERRIKGQAIADYLADYPSEQLELMDSEFPDEDVMTVDEDNHGRWKLYFDGAANAVGSGIGAVLVSPKGQQTPIAVKLGFDCTNNMTEYEACIVGLQAALEFGAYELEVFGDSLLIVSQTNGEWQARDPKLIPYQRYISRLVPKFKYVTFTYTPRAHNHFADALATLASLIKLEIDDKPWYYDIKRFIQDREYPPRATENEKKYIRRMAFQFFLSGEILYKRTHDATLLRCVDAEEANRHVQTCHKCQMYQNSKNAPPQYLHTMASPWPFSAWGMDVIGAITPKASNGHEFILVAIDYFTKWVEACSFKNVTQVAVTRFVKNNIICRYGMPEMLITDNASNLNNRMMDQLCQQFKIQHHNSAPYRPKDERSHWHEHLPYALCALPNVSEDIRWSYPLLSGIWDGSRYCQVEVEIPSLRILSQTQLEEAEWAQARYEQLNFIDEKRLAALCHGQLYQRRIERAYNKKARPRTFQPGDLVLKKRNMALIRSTRKVRTII